jgi:hypothetical protein
MIYNGAIRVFPQLKYNVFIISFYFYPEFVLAVTVLLVMEKALLD